jgi:hypothetical protein
MEDEDSSLCNGVPWWKLTVTPGGRARFGGEKRLAAYLWFNVRVGGTFTMEVSP